MQPSRLAALVGGLTFCLFLLVVPSPLSAQVSTAPADFALLVSISADSDLMGLPVRDEDLVRHLPGAPAFVAWPAETLALLTGDAGGDGLHDVFGDVDAIHDGGVGATVGEGLLLSLVANEAGFLDGDVLGFSGGQASVFMAEATFVALVGASDGDVDVDAFHLDDNGRIVFSLADDEDSTSLSGDDPGVVQDGAILTWMPGETSASLLWTEAEVSGLVTAALGSTQNVGDTKGLGRDPGTGALLFSVQSPSAHDASVFTDAAGGALVSGHAEDDLGFGTNAELDGLSLASEHFAGLTVSAARPQASELVTARLSGATPGMPYLILAALDLGPVLMPLDGWGGLVLANDSLLAISLDSVAALLVLPDGLGSGEIAKQLPDGLSAVDVVLQAVAPGGHARGSNPLIIEMAQ